MKKENKSKLFKISKVTLISGVFSLILVALGIVFINNSTLVTNFFIVAIVVLVVPYGIRKTLEFKKTQAYEREFPLFLRDISEGFDVGVNIIQNIQITAKSDYGSLTKEIEKMRIKLSWNVPIEEVLNDFKNKMKDSDLIKRSTIILIQAIKSGDNLKEVVSSLVRNVDLIQQVNKDKSALLGQQTIIMYAIFYAFLAVAIGLIAFIVPLINTGTLTTTFTSGVIETDDVGGNHPCTPCISGEGRSCGICDGLFIVSNSFGFGEKEETNSYYRAIFFSMMVIQSIFSGLIIGQINSDSISGGYKHVGIMLISGIFIFVLASRIL